jgi:hypothetical protein
VVDVDLLPAEHHVMAAPRTLRPPPSSGSYEMIRCFVDDFRPGSSPGRGSASDGQVPGRLERGATSN